MTQTDTPMATAWTEGLLDDLSDAISDSIDMDWTPSIGAKAVLHKLEAEYPAMLAAHEMVDALKECHRALMHYEWYANPASGWSREENKFVRFMTEAALSKAGVA